MTQSTPQAPVNNKDFWIVFLLLDIALVLVLVVCGLLLTGTATLNDTTLPPVEVETPEPVEAEPTGRRRFRWRRRP